MNRHLKLSRPRPGRMQAQVITQERYRGPHTNQEHIQVTGPVLICGAHASGKTKMIQRLAANSAEIWGHQVAPYAHTNLMDVRRRAKEEGIPMLRRGETLDSIGWAFPQPVEISAATPLGQWIDHDGMRSWWTTQADLPEWDKLKLHVRVEKIAEYLRDTRAVLFVDDADKLTGRKAAIAKSCLHSAFRWVATASDEGAIPPSLREDLLTKHPQIIRLTSNVAYDATPGISWLLVLLAVIAGYPEAAAVIGGLAALRGGARATRQK